jgi:hypothetical protein
VQLQAKQCHNPTPYESFRQPTSLRIHRVFFAHRSRLHLTPRLVHMWLSAIMRMTVLPLVVLMSIITVVRVASCPCAVSMTRLVKHSLALLA